MGGREVNPTFWEGRKVFVTGHTGFKGSWLVLLLRELGADVTGFALAPPQARPSLFEQAGIAKACTSVLGDIRDLDTLRAAVSESGASVVLHLAAQAIVRQSYDDPVGTYSTNIMGTVNLLEATRGQATVKGIVVVTSDKCYENREWARGYRESDAMGGHDPYSSSKGCAELVVSAYARSYFSSGDAPALASARAGNVVGGGDYAQDRLVPDLLRAFTEGEVAEIRNPNATRPWQHVLDPLSGYIVLAERLVTNGGAFAGGWNFGPDAASVRSVRHVADALAEKWGGGASWALTKGANPHEAQSLSLDCSKARSELGWKPLLDLDACLDWIVTWTQAASKGGSAREECLRQVRTYMRQSAFPGAYDEGCEVLT